MSVRNWIYHRYLWIEKKVAARSNRSRVNSITLSKDYSLKRGASIWRVEYDGNIIWSFLNLCLIDYFKGYWVHCETDYLRFLRNIIVLFWFLPLWIKFFHHIFQNQSLFFLLYFSLFFLLFFLLLLLQLLRLN
jgi:hypothetical protein